MRIALFQPDIPQNAAAIIRLGACLGVPVDIIQPCGFLFSDAGFRRAGMDYVELADVLQHASWEAFLAARRGRIVLMTTKARLAYTEFSFRESDIMLLGRESAGVPEEVATAIGGHKTRSVFDRYNIVNGGKPAESLSNALQRSYVDGCSQWGWNRKLFRI